MIVVESVVVWGGYPTGGLESYPQPILASHKTSGYIRMDAW
jgi:hypothetical protein